MKGRLQSLSSILASMTVAMEAHAKMHAFLSEEVTNLERYIATIDPATPRKIPRRTRSLLGLFSSVFTVCRMIRVFVENKLRDALGPQTGQRA